MLRCALGLLFCVSCWEASSLLAPAADKETVAPPEKKAAADSTAPTLTKKWTVLFNPSSRAARKGGPLPANSPLQNLKELTFTGPEPGHPFVIGDYTEDGDFGIVNGGLQRVTGQNAALQLPVADQFELEGTMEQIEFGGWFMLVGWEDQRGYLISNATMKESGSPWFLTELRGSAAVPEGTKTVVKYEWLRTQPFRLTVRDRQVTFEIGERKILNAEPMENYAPGRVILGVYDTRYGPKKIHIGGLRMRAIEDAAEPKEKDAE